MPLDIQRQQTSPSSSDRQSDGAQPSAATSSTVQLRGKGLSDQQAALAPGAGGLAVQQAALAPGHANVQMDGGGGTGDVHAAAARGTSGSGGALPHLDAIQTSFGQHDVSSVQAYTGGAAQEASQSMGAEAYATGNKVAFGTTPSLHTAAHEAAHVVQQRSGVSLSGGVGKAGDSYEQHADRVADAVVAGKSAEPVLNQMAGGGGGGVQQSSVQQASVQRDGEGGGGGAASLAAQVGVAQGELEAFARSQGMGMALDRLNAGAPVVEAPGGGGGEDIQRKELPGAAPAAQTQAAPSSSAGASVQRQGSGGPAVQMQGPTRADAQEITLPTGHTLSGWQVHAFRALLQSMPNGSGTILLAAMDISNAANCTIGIGVGVSGGAAAGAGFGGLAGAGVLCAPGNKIGYYGTAGGMGGILMEVSASAQVTVVKGGVENFGGVALAVGGSFYAEFGGGGCVLFTPGGEFLGVAVEGGVGVGFSVYGSVSGTAVLSEGRVTAGG